eukprot:TRINITY_DN50258_c0_g1_i1.p1 TRINITY_DN50258_c0_g1~~TRINITY_DN50258_c0_g1_i1.p1  ORF type:complete len:267 (+),score=14.80 TRINITY_DN50258_c0_g1_i1:69-869(+)
MQRWPLLLLFLIPIVDASCDQKCTDTCPCSPHLGCDYCYYGSCVQAPGPTSVSVFHYNRRSSIATGEYPSWHCNASFIDFHTAKPGYGPSWANGGVGYPLRFKMSWNNYSGRDGESNTNATLYMRGKAPMGFHNASKLFLQFKFLEGEKGGTYKIQLHANPHAFPDAYNLRVVPHFDGDVAIPQYCSLVDSKPVASTSVHYTGKGTKTVQVDVTLVPLTVLAGLVATFDVPMNCHSVPGSGGCSGGLTMESVIIFHTDKKCHPPQN